MGVANVDVTADTLKAAKPKPPLLFLSGRFVIPAHAAAAEIPFDPSGLTSRVNLTLKLRFNGRTKKLKLKLVPPKI